MLSNVGVIFGCILSGWRCLDIGEAEGVPNPGELQARLPLETQDWETGEGVLTCSIGTICLLGFPGDEQHHVGRAPVMLAEI